MSRTIIKKYDEENDIMYINFYDPPLEADYSQRDRNCIFRYRELEVIGVTILDWRSYNLSDDKYLCPKCGVDLYYDVDKSEPWPLMCRKCDYHSSEETIRE